MYDLAYLYQKQKSWYRGRVRPNIDNIFCTNDLKAVSYWYMQFLYVYIFWLVQKIAVEPIVKSCQIIQICILFKYLKVGLNIIVLCIKGPWIGVCNNRLNRNVRVCVNCDPSEFLPTHPLPPIYILPLFPNKPLNPNPQFLLAKPPFSLFMPAEYDYLYAGLRNMFYILPPPRNKHS